MTTHRQENAVPDEVVSLDERPEARLAEKEFTRQREALTRRMAMWRDRIASKSLENSRRLVTAMIDLNS